MIHVLLYRRVRPRVYRRIATGFAQRVIRLSLGRSGATRPLTMHDGERVFVGGIVRSEIDATFAIQRESESPEGREPARLLRVFECLASDSGFRRRAPPSEPSAPPPPDHPLRYPTESNLARFPLRSALSVRVHRLSFIRTAGKSFGIIMHVCRTRVGVHACMRLCWSTLVHCMASRRTKNGSKRRSSRSETEKVGGRMRGRAKPEG